MRAIKEELIEKLAESTPKEFKIVVMPHFCIDSSVQYEDDYKLFGGVKTLAKIHIIS